MVARSEPQLVFVAGNKHSTACGEPPGTRNEGRAHRYYGYFENASGEQWVFVYDGETRRGVLQGGDVHWDKVHAVGEDGVVDLVLTDPERQWLAACWRAARARFSWRGEPASCSRRDAWQVPGRSAKALPSCDGPDRRCLWTGPGLSPIGHTLPSSSLAAVLGPTGGPYPRRHPFGTLSKRRRS